MAETRYCHALGFVAHTLDMPQNLILTIRINCGNSTIVCKIIVRIFHYSAYK